MLSYCLANRINFIHISTIRIYEYFKKHVIDIAKKQKYNIEVYALAVPNLESKKSAILRELEIKSLFFFCWLLRCKYKKRYFFRNNI